MKSKNSNETATDADIRDRSLWTGEQLSIQVTIKARQLKRALDKFEEQQFKRAEKSE